MQIFVRRYIKPFAVDTLSSSVLLTVVDFLTQSSFLTSGQRWLFIDNYDAKDFTIRNDRSTSQTPLFELLEKVKVEEIRRPGQ